MVGLGTIINTLAILAGGICGRSVNKKLDSRAVDKLFIALMVVLILVNLYNIYRFL